MRAIMLAAGMGKRLSGLKEEMAPKVLLKFDGKTLLQRHVETLVALGIKRLMVVVGYRKEEIVDSLEKLSPPGFAYWVENPAFHEGSVISMWSVREEFSSGENILFMDSDILYHPEMLFRLIKSKSNNCFLFDRHLVLGEDPVRLCLRNSRPVDIGKQVNGAYDLVGEWPGILKVSPEIGNTIAHIAQAFVLSGQRAAPYEDVLRDTLQQSAAGTFAYEDISGLPWIEIDYPEDLIRAHQEIFPRILSYKVGD